MPPTPLVDLAALDLSRTVATKEQVYSLLPQRFEFEVIDGILHMDRERHILIAYRDVDAGQWWCRGHLPGRPIFPGVLMVETAAQMAAYYHSMVLGNDKFMAFGGIDDVKFRGAVLPPSRIILVGRALEIRSRRTTVEVQAYVEERMVFEGKITGMPID